MKIKRRDAVLFERPFLIDSRARSFKSAHESAPREPQSNSHT